MRRRVTRFPGRRDGLLRQTRVFCRVPTRSWSRGVAAPGTHPASPEQAPGNRKRDPRGWERARAEVRVSLPICARARGEREGGEACGHGSQGSQSRPEKTRNTETEIEGHESGKGRGSFHPCWKPEELASEHGTDPRGVGQPDFAEPPRTWRPCGRLFEFLLRSQPASFCQDSQCPAAGPVPCSVWTRGRQQGGRLQATTCRRDRWHRVPPALATWERKMPSYPVPQSQQDRSAPVTCPRRGHGQSRSAEAEGSFWR